MTEATTPTILPLTLSDGTEVEVKLVDISNQYIDWRFKNTPGDQKTVVTLSSMENANVEMIAAIEYDLSLGG